MNVKVDRKALYFENQAKLEKQVREKFEQVRNSGLIAGSKAICGVVLEKAKDEEKSVEERIHDIIDFCERSLGVAEKNDITKEVNNEDTETEV
jgi:hypothetical protein